MSPGKSSGSTKEAKQPLPPLPELIGASIESEKHAELIFSGPVVKAPPPKTFKLLPGGAPRAVRLNGENGLTLEADFDPKKSFRVRLPDEQIIPLPHGGILDAYVSDKPLGLTWADDERATLRFFAPRADEVRVFIFAAPGEKPLAELPMDFDSRAGVWEVETPDLQPGLFYGYRVRSDFAEGDIGEIIFADPYSWAVVKRNTWLQESLTVVLPRDVYDLPPAAHLEVPAKDLVVYEAHLKDFSALAATVPEELRGTYSGAVYDAVGSPLRNMAELGVNAVEWLPLQNYHYLEPPYNDSSLPVHNTWNRYSRNHWGYMPSHYFAPEARYAVGASGHHGDWIGGDGKQVLEMREMVERLHEKGIAVILDVVYNHVAQYGHSLLRMLDPEYFLRLDREGKRTDLSGCGNDLKTERPMVRRLIIESLRHWARFYGIDGFRFDLAGLIDDATLEEITSELRREWPEILLIAEPWGGRYGHERFSRLGWSAWNDLFRNGIRGTDPEHGKGFVFGKWGPNDSDRTLIRHFTGHLKTDGGPFRQEGHALNYLACHDGYTLGDFIRIASGRIGHNAKTTIRECYRMTVAEIKNIRLAMFILFTSRGAVMLQAGDEWARPKLIAGDNVPDPLCGTLDPDSYEKDDRTNWLDWSRLDDAVAGDLRNYVRGLIELRTMRPILRHAGRGDLSLLGKPGPFSLIYRLKNDNDDVLILLNADPEHETSFALPNGRWIVHADHQNASGKRSVSGIRSVKATLPPTAGALLVREDQPEKDS